MKILIILLICILLFYFLSCKTYREQYKTNMNRKTDFVTLCFENEIEMDLMKLQAMSFAFVPSDLVHEIIICWNDIGPFPSNFSIIEYYPKILRPKVKCISRNDIFDTEQKSDWRNQQICKLVVAKQIKAPHYIILDAKNHFIKPITEKHFYNEEGKPKLYLGNPGKMISYFDYCLQYFNIEKQNLQIASPYSVEDPNCQFCTTTPFIFKTDIVLEMMSHMESVENLKFPDLFLLHKEGTEFYFYISYLIWKEYIQGYHIQKKMHVTLWPDLEKEWNQLDYIENSIEEEDCQIFGLHRKAIVKMEKEQIQDLLKFYTKFYSKKMLKQIKCLKIFAKKR